MEWRQDAAVVVAEKMSAAAVAGLSAPCNVLSRVSRYDTECWWCWTGC